MINQGNMKIAVLPTDVWACGKYRMEIPYSHLKQWIKGIEIIDFRHVINFDLLSKFDIIVLQRVIAPEVIDIMKRLKQIGKILIHEIDDNVFNIKQDNPSYNTYKSGSPYVKNFIQACKIADYIHTTNDYLANEISKKTNVKREKIHVFPNSLDLSHPNYKVNLRANLPQDKIIFGYQGGSSHGKDITHIIQPVKEVLDRFPETMFAFCSSPELFRKFSIDVRRAIVIPPETKNFYNFIPIPSSFDIGLIPVDDKDDFNLSKSYLKILEYGAYKIPTIATNMGDYSTYSSLHSDESVRLVKNRHEKWVKSIIELIQNPELRATIGNNANKSLVDGITSLTYINTKRLNFYIDICNKKI